MKTATVVLGLLLLGFVAFGRTQGKEPEPVHDLSTPDATVRTFLAEILKSDLKRAGTCVIGALSEDKLAFYAKALQQGPAPKDAPVISDIKSEIKDDTATVTLKLIINDKTQQTGEDVLQLRKEGADWKLVPATVDSLRSAPDLDQKFVTIAVLAVTDESVLKGTWEAAVRATCVSNMKQQCLGALMYMQDYDEVYPRPAAKYQELTMPYIKANKVFHCPLDTSGKVSYSFNKLLAGKPDKVVSKHATTVMIYEGKDQKLEFRHQGRAVVGFTDGHVKLIDATAAKTLRWKP